MGEGKLIYLLPTMVTANSIFTRLEDYFGKGNVGLTHSTASFMSQEEEENPEERRNVLFDKTFIEGENKLQAAMLFDDIYISIDGSSQATVEKYQVGEE